MSKTADQLARLASIGASLEVSGKTADQLTRIASLLRPGATLRVLDADNKTSDQLARIASIKPGQVIFHLP